MLRELKRFNGQGITDTQRPKHIWAAQSVLGPNLWHPLLIVWCRETFFQAIYTSEITESGEFEVSEFEVGILKFVELDIVN